MRAIGIVLAGGNSKRMRELSNKRAIAAMPIAGSYRSVDFALSNMSNSHIQSVAVLTQYNSRSLNEHLSSSKWWDFGRKQGGMYVFTPTITAESSDWYRGTADALYQNLDFLKKSHEPYVVIAGGDCVYKLDYGKVLEYHIEKKADITVVCKEMPPEEDVTRFGLVKLNDDGRITDSQGRTVDFKNTILIMTSNIGAQKITGAGRKSLGFADGKPEDAAERTFEQIKEDVMGELKNAVRPEFLNRIDDIIVFNRLNEDEIAQIADGMLRKVAERMKDMEISMTWTEAAKKHLAKAGFDPLYGARPLRRAVTSEVEDLVAEESLEGRISKGSEVVLDVENDKLVLKTKDAETKAE